ncbi:hypothetical protein HYH03_013150 [Edaphochlamys debaryana]|uniref:MYND-type domain-containing protein n=1 Tax=Edaphochlamys debaryana TaxID=47281 RepID=A0A835XWU1_9CHLO|nr:hypothetical protein HYH03_013150 [Edaphochlamys debaryana]|eukprot:KAG2488300.1 hypothetical protein HYH03_013150 [Edaphochlamys debaryana]
MPPRRQAGPAAGGARPASGPLAASGNPGLRSALPAFYPGWLRLPAIADGLLGPAAAASAPAAASGFLSELKQLASAAATFDPTRSAEARNAPASMLRARADAIAELCWDGRCTSALMRLLSGALRAGPGGSGGGPASPALRSAEAQGILCELLGSMFGPIGQLRPGPHAIAVARLIQTVVRTQTLQAISRALAAAAAPLAALEAGGAIPPSRSELMGAAHLLSGALVLSVGLVNVTYAQFRPSMAYPRMAPQYQETEACLERCRTELAAALQASGVVEQSARLLVLLLQAGVEAAAAAGGVEERRTVTGLRFGFASLAWYMMLNATGHDEHGAQLCSREAAAVISAALTGRCARHALMAHSVGILCAEDGGPTYGLTQPLLPAEAAAASTAVAARGGGGDNMRTWRGDAGNAKVTGLQSFLLAVIGTERGLQLPNGRPGRRATLALVQRIGRAAVAQACRTLRFPPPQQLQGGTDTQVAHLMVAALAASGKLLPGPPLPEGWEAEAAEWWRQALEAGRYLLLPETQAMAVDTWCLSVGTLAKALQRSCRDPDGYLRLPPKPPPELAAALAGGLLPATDAASALLKTLPIEGTFPQLRPRLPLLAYGDPTHVASLIRTGGKMLRQWHPRHLRGEDASLRGYCFLNLFCDLLDEAATTWPGLDGRQAASGPGQSGSGQSGSGQSGPGQSGPGLSGRQRQLAVMVSLMAAEWLPPLARLAEAVLDKAPSLALASMTALLTVCIRAISAWVPVLSCAAVLEDQQGPAAGAAACDAASGSGVADASGEAGGWRDFLLKELRPHRLLVLPVDPSREEDFYIQGALQYAFFTKAPFYCFLRACEDSLDPGQARKHVAAFAASGKGANPRAARALVSPTADELQAAADAATAEAFQQAKPLAAVLLPPERARREALPQRCGLGPACVNLAGDSEAGLALRPCTGCRAVLFCSRECQKAAMQAGHKEACAGAKGRAG